MHPVGGRRVAVAALIAVLAALVGAPMAFAAPQYGVMNAPEGVFWRSEPNWAAAERISGFGVYDGTIIEVHCYQGGTAVEGSDDTMWEQATDVGGRGYGSGWVNEHFINDGQPINQPSPGVPPCGGAPPPEKPPHSEEPPVTGGLVFPIFNAEGGIYYRSSPHWADTPAIPGVGVYSSDQVQLICGAFGDPVGPFNDTAWSYVNNLSRPVGDGWVNEHFINDGMLTNQFVSGEPTCGAEIPGLSGGGQSGGGGAPEPPAFSAPGGPGGSAGGSSLGRDPCISRYPSGRQHTKNVFGGKETDYDRQASLFHVCEGFGAPEAFHFSLTPTMQCALIAAAATYGGPIANAGVSGGCEVGTVLSDIASRQWLGIASGRACAYFNTVFASSAGIFAAGATSETGPGAVAVGVNTYRALTASLKVVCGGLFNAIGTALGKKIEANHEASVANHVTRHGLCIKLRHVFGIWSWGNVTCT